MSWNKWISVMVVSWGVSAWAELPMPPPADPETTAVLRQQAAVAAIEAGWRAAATNEADVLVLPGLRADRAARTVTILAEAAGVPVGEPLEFVLISPTSGHDYETVAVAHAMPSDVHAALDFIGLPAGAPYMPRRYRFAPKGEPLQIRMAWTNAAGERQDWAVEELVWNQRTGTTLATNAWLFVGSQWLEESTGRVYAADQYGPRAIVSLYSEPTTVIDRSTVAAQGAVYGAFTPHPERRPAYGTLMEVTLTPALEAGARRVQDVEWSVEPGEGDVPVSLWLAQDGERLNERPDVAGCLAVFEEWAAAGQMPHVTLAIDASVPVAEVRGLMAVLQELESGGVLAVEPPRPGDAYYKAWVPDERFREPADRPSLALEVRLEREGETVRGRLVQMTDQRARREDPFDPQVSEWTVETPADLAAQLDTLDYWLKVLLIFAPDDLTYGEVLDWWRPVAADYGTLYVFLESPLAAAPQD
jgi:hypothetical protein